MDETRLDKIEIKELEVFANHGVYPEENVLGQKFVISATNLEIVRVDTENNLLLVKGAVPGPKKSLVTIKETVKSL